jgi:hypothetical protein
VPGGLALAAVALALSGCGAASTSAAGSGSPMSGTQMSGTQMSGTQMSGMSISGMDMSSGPDAATAPTQAASMICGDEIRTAVQHTLELSRAPERVRSWANRLYRCTYRLAGRGELRLSVKDLDSAGPGRAYFDWLRASTAGATTITGLAGFGFPAFESPAGDVVFLKDHRALRVDASGLTSADLPSGITREVAAYGVAASVIACWTE